MKAYVKPSIEIIELKPEERLANCAQVKVDGKTLLRILILKLLGVKCIPCTVSGVCSSTSS